jgi:hypothetical protein
MHKNNSSIVPEEDERDNEKGKRAGSPEEVHCAESSSLEGGGSSEEDDEDDEGEEEEQEESEDEEDGEDGEDE